MSRIKEHQQEKTLTVSRTYSDKTKHRHVWWSLPSTTPAVPSHSHPLRWYHTRRALPLASPRGRLSRAHELAPASRRQSGRRGCTISRALATQGLSSTRGDSCRQPASAGSSQRQRGPASARATPVSRRSPHTLQQRCRAVGRPRAGTRTIRGDSHSQYKYDMKGESVVKVHEWYMTAGSRGQSPVASKNATGQLGCPLSAAARRADRTRLPHLKLLRLPVAPPSLPPRCRLSRPSFAPGASARRCPSAGRCPPTSTHTTNQCQ